MSRFLLLIGAIVAFSGSASRLVLRLERLPSADLV
jgi:hypothetical protein